MVTNGFYKNLPGPDVSSPYQEIELGTRSYGGIHATV